jgi:hypothetical protein
MAYEPKESFGALHKNDKGDNANRPDYRGDIMLGGVVYELGGWIKDGKSGKFMSLSGKVKESRAPREVDDRPTTKPRADGDIPF